jgi:hypothetical protein
LTNADTQLQLSTGGTSDAADGRRSLLQSEARPGCEPEAALAVQPPASAAVANRVLPLLLLSCASSARDEPNAPPTAPASGSASLPADGGPTSSVAAAVTLASNACSELGSAAAAAAAMKDAQ